MIQTETRVLTAHIPLDMANQIDQLAGKLERSKSWIIKQALASWIEQESLRERLTREALADVDEGNFVSHDDIQAWAMSLNSNQSKPTPI
ncbi:CopG family transcripitonal regulator [Thiomicrospira aerophila AL3]|uniref:CopG family transcripitonal regulator n=1 Tax=Thiomicrospira aerophila AL3 TaxID=717772 RepID=W0DRH8_9GAMM|nr:ribbon-helix-helix domain-containing protein [Thiomicrospira aerophila]AHF01205.1 CopG family transcripitonal regulator [Thiomicrospira aerophila AL3]